MQDRHTEFLKRIRLPEEQAQKKEDSRKTRSSTHKMPEQEQHDLQRELEAKFDELFGGLNDEED